MIVKEIGFGISRNEVERVRIWSFFKLVYQSFDNLFHEIAWGDYVGYLWICMLVYLWKSISVGGLAIGGLLAKLI